MERAVTAGEREPLRQRHAKYFLAIAERAEPELRGSEQDQWFARLLEDEGNFRAALTWALEVGGAEVGLRLAGVLWMFWRWAGLFAEGRAWLDTALAAGEACSQEVRARDFGGPVGWPTITATTSKRMRRGGGCSALGMSASRGATL